MSWRQIKTFEWKCDVCGRKAHGHGTSAYDSVPTSFGKFRPTPNAFWEKDICSNCWADIPEQQKSQTPVELLPVNYKAS